MSEEKKLSAFKIFAQTLQTYEEAEEKAKKEAGTPRVERFRIGEDGEYTIRILPLAPIINEDGSVVPMTHTGYEYPLHQLFLGIKAAGKKGGKAKKINIPVIRTTDKEVGYSVDLIDTYVKIAKEMYGDDDDLMELINGNSYSGGLRWGYAHAIMVLDLSSDKERAKGPQLWQCSHSQYKDIDDAKMRLWAELREDGEQRTCPISGFTDAYPVKVIRTNNNGKTEYKLEIGRKPVDLKEEEVMKLLDLPRIPELIYRYTKYQLEATVAYLQQYDEEHGMEICAQADFAEAVEKLKGELPADDNSHFDLSGAVTKGSEKEETTVDSLWREYDLIVDQGLNEKSDEYQELREKIRQFIEDNELDIRITRTKNNQQLLEEIDQVVAENGLPEQKTKKEESEAPVRRPTPKPEVEEETEEEEEEEEEDKVVPAPAPAPRVRRPRPADDVEEEPIEEPAPAEPEEESEDEQPRRRTRARRLR